MVIQMELYLLLLLRELEITSSIMFIKTVLSLMIFMIMKIKDYMIIINKNLTNLRKIVLSQLYYIGLNLDHKNGMNYKEKNLTLTKERFLKS
jgi:hypothetical protein